MINKQRWFRYLQIPLLVLFIFLFYFDIKLLVPIIAFSLIYEGLTIIKGGELKIRSANHVERARAITKPIGFGVLATGIAMGISVVFYGINILMGRPIFAMDTIGIIACCPFACFIVLRAFLYWFLHWEYG